LRATPRLLVRVDGFPTHRSSDNSQARAAARCG
jgi:hypothetical protein